MEHYDSQMAARVWQRVQNTQTETPVADISLLLQEEAADLSRYRQLQNTLGSTSKPLLQQLMRKTQQCISILRGIAYLLTDTVPAIKPYPLPKELPVSSLRHAYGATLRRINLYGGWQDHPEYGPGFQTLHALSAERCSLLLQLLGI